VTRDSSWERLRVHTDRLCLRVAAAADAEPLHELFADAEVMRALGKRPVSTLAQVEAMIDEGTRGWRAAGLGPFVLATAGPHPRVVGQAGLMVFASRDWTPSTWERAGPHAQPELGWSLIPAHRGCGYATEAAAAIRDWACGRSIGRLVSLISPGNVPSQRLAERLGAVPAETVTPADTGRPTVVWRHRPCG
jgi:RimJ/RimL family protein N-acetyltransferase